MLKCLGFFDAMMIFDNSLLPFSDVDFQVCVSWVGEYCVILGVGDFRSKSLICYRLYTDWAWIDGSKSLDLCYSLDRFEHSLSSSKYLESTCTGLSMIL